LPHTENTDPSFTFNRFPSHLQPSDPTFRRDLNQRDADSTLYPCGCAINCSVQSPTGLSSQRHQSIPSSAAYPTSRPLIIGTLHSQIATNLPEPTGISPHGYRSSRADWRRLPSTREDLLLSSAVGPVSDQSRVR